MNTTHLRLPTGFPSPSTQELAITIDMLKAVPKDCALIIDGLAFGVLPAERLKEVKAPIIAMVHHPLGLEPGLDPDRSDILIQKEQRALTQAQHVITPSPHVARLLTQTFSIDPARITVAEPGVTRIIPQKRRVTQPPLILSVGLLAHRKGHDVLLKALAQLQDLSWRAQIIGKEHEPNVMKDLQAIIQRHDLGARVQITGMLPSQIRDQAYAEASVFALATRYEGYGMVFNEAMQYGLPIVTCNVGAVPDTVGDAGLIVECDDCDGLSQALRELLEVPQKAVDLSNRALASAQSLPSWADTATKFANVIAALASITPERRKRA